MNLCDEQTLITKFNLTKETILQMPEKEISFRNFVFYTSISLVLIFNITKPFIIKVLNGFVSNIKMVHKHIF